MKPFFRLFSVLVASAFLVSCEETKGGSFSIMEENDEPSVDNRSSSVSGKWTGRSGSGQWKSIMELRESGGSVSGSMTWVHANDTRSVSGSRSGSSLTLHIGGGDVWHLTVSGNRMTGSGDKAGTNRSYNLSFTR